MWLPGLRVRALVAISLFVLLFEAIVPAPVAGGSAGPEPVRPAELATPAEPGDRTPAEAAERVELTNKRTIDSRIFLNPDGTYTSEFSTFPIHYQAAGDDEWLPIELGFRQSSRAGEVAASERAPVAIGLGESTASDGFLTVESAGHRITFSLPASAVTGRTPVRPVIDGIAADYADLLPGVDLRVFARAQGPKTFLILDAPPTIPSWTFAVDAPGLTLEPQANGSVHFIDAEGQTVAYMPDPYAVDSSVDELRGGGQYTDAVELAVSAVGGLNLVTLTADPTWLAAATYPVYVDPSVTFYVGGTNYGDAHVSRAWPNTNYGDYVRPDNGYHELWHGQDPSNSNNYNYDYFRFELSSIAGVTVDSASFRFYPYHQYQSPSTIWVGYVTGSWTESGITWNNQPGMVAVTSASTSAGSYASFTVTSTVQSWVSGSLTNYGFRAHSNNQNYTYWKRLLSSEHSSGDPALVVTYHQPTASVVSPTGSAWTNSRLLTWSYSDPAGHAQSHYEVQVSTASDFSSIYASSGQVASSSTSWSIPTGTTLTNGTTYYWRVRAKDGTSWSPWSAGAAFRWDGSAPSFTSAGVGGAITAEDPNFYDLGNGTFTVAIRGSDANSGIKLSYLRLYNGSDEMRVRHDWSVGGAHCDEFDTSTLVDATACAETYNSGGTREVTFTVVGLSQTTSFDAHYYFTDYSGNTVGYDDTGKNLIFDASAPTGSISSPAASATVSGTVTISGTASDANFTQYELHYGAGASPSSWSSIGTFTSSVTNGTLGSWNVAGLASGTYTARLRVYDKARVSSGFTEVLRAVSVDNNAPTAIISSPTGDRLVDGTIDITGTASATAFFADYTLRYGVGCAPSNWFDIGTNPRTNQVTNGTLGTWNSDGLSGKHAIRLTVNRSDGQTSTATVCVTLGSSLGRQSQHSFESWDLGAGDELAVNVATGNVVLTHPLVSLPFRGGTLALSLVHNSFSANDRGLGPGWQLSEQRRLGLWLGNSTVTFVDGDGSRHHFTNPVTNGTVTTYTRPASLYATLVRDTANPDEFTLSYRDGSVDTFYLAGTAGRLTRSADRHGNALTYAYDPAGNLETITDPTGRTANFTWDTIPNPHRLTAISDWAWIDGSAVVQTTNTGSRRTYRFFYDGASQLIGWSDPLNTSGTCPTGGSHLTCLAYTSGRLTALTKSQTVTTFSDGALGTATRAITTALSHSADGRVASVTDAEQVAQSGPATTVTWETASRVRVNRPTTTTSYGLVDDDDPFARIESTWRDLNSTLIERRIVWDGAFSIEPASVTDNYGALLGTPARTVTFTYVAGSLALVSRMVEPLTDSTNRWTDYAYNSNHDVTQLIFSQDGSGTVRTETRFCYTTDPACPTTGAGPDLLRQIDNYVSGGSLISDTNVTTEFVYDGYGQQTRTIRHNCSAASPCIFDGSTWSGGLDHRVDAFLYDANGNLTTEIVNYVDGQVTSPGDDITPNATTLARTDLTTTHAYDTAGNRVSSADPRRPIEAAKGTSLGADDFITRWTYDALNQPLTERTPTTPGLASTQRTAATTYDELGLVRSAADFGGLVTASEFDRSGRALRTFEDPDPGSAAVTSQLTYDADGRPLTAKDRRQLADGTLGQTTYGDDAMGRRTSVVEADGTASEAETTTGYDALDRRTRYEVGVGAGGSLLTTYVYDLGGRVIQTDDGSACAEETFDYRDLAITTTSGLVGGTCQTGSEQRTLTHTHDGVGRRTRSEVTSGADAGDRTVDDVYDAAGNRRSAAVRTGGATTTTTFTVSLLDQAVAETRADGSTAKTTYDPAANAADRCFWAPGATVSACHPFGTSPWPDPPTQVTTTDYDARNQHVSLADAAGGSFTTYDPEHNYAIKAFYRSTGSGREHQSLYAYDARHRLTGITFQTCAANVSHACTDTPVNTGTDNYAYDDADNRTQVVESNGSTSADFRYCHDARNQLTYRNIGAACSSSANDEAWTYDEAGNRLTATSGGSTTNFAFHADGRLCDVEVGAAAGCSGGNVSHDSAGRIESWNGWTFAYDAEGRLTLACRSLTCASGYDRVDFTYDGEGHRTQIVATSAGGSVTTTQFRYQGDVVVEEKVNGTVVRQFLTDEAGAISKLLVPDGQTDAGTYLVSWNGHGDALNLLRVNGDGTTTLANSFTYDTWGRPTTTTHGGIGNLGFRYLYVGRFDVQWDDQFGLDLHYVHARHYSPVLGRFLQPDPAALEPSRYSYAQNCPVTRIDPTGLAIYLRARARRVSGRAIPVDCGKVELWGISAGLGKMDITLKYTAPQGSNVVWRMAVAVWFNVNPAKLRSGVLLPFVGAAWGAQTSARWRGVFTGSGPVVVGGAMAVLIIGAVTAGCHGEIWGGTWVP